MLSDVSSTLTAFTKEKPVILRVTGFSYRIEKPTSFIESLSVLAY